MQKTFLRKRATSVAVAVILSILMVLSTAVLPCTKDSVTSYAATFKDTSNHWAKSYIADAVNFGFVQGYSDNTFRPDNPITRAEFTKMLNAAIGNNGTTDIGFWDTIPGEWYYEDVQKGVAAGYISGRSETTFAPNATITRQEAAVMLSRIIPAYGSKSTLKAYSDYTDVSDWAASSLEKMTAKNYIGAYSDGKLHPKNNLTRAQAAKIITEVLKNENIDANNKRVVAHDGPDLTLENTIYANRMTIDASATDDLITFSNCTILGNLNIEGGEGGSDEGISLENSRVSTVNLDAGENEVRVYAKGETSVKNINVSDTAVVENGYLTGSGDFGEGFENVMISRGSDATLVGDFDYVEITGSKVDLKTESGKISTLKIDTAASDTTVDVGEDAELYNVEDYASTAFLGEGIITKLNAYANGITYEKKPSQIVTAASVNIPPLLAIDAERALVIAPVPADGETKVSTSEDIVLRFSSVVHMTDFSGTRLTDTQAENIISLRKGSAGGASVSFTATVADDGKSVSLTPTNALKEDTTYYLRIAAGELTDQYGHENELFTSSFSTGLTSYDIQFSPTKAETEVSLTAIPTITFSEPVMRYSSGSPSLTAQYLHDSVITFEKVGPNQLKRTSVDFTAVIDSSSREITITPRAKLDEETTYYITINGRTLMTQSDKKAIETQESNFTTISNSLSDRVASATDSDKAKITFKALQKGTVYGIIFKQSELESERPTAENIKDFSYVSSVSANTDHHASVTVSKGDLASMEFSSLEANTAYYIYLVLYEGEDTPGNVFVETVSTSQKLPTLSSITIDAYTAAEIKDNTKPDGTTNVLKGSDGATKVTYYIGPEATQLRVTPEQTAGQDESLECDITVSSLVQGIEVEKTSPVTIKIPSAQNAQKDGIAATDLGTINIAIGGNNKQYGTKKYEVELKRIVPEIQTVSFTGSSTKVKTWTDETQNASNAAVSVELTSVRSTEDVQLIPDILSKDYVKYKVEASVDGTWTPVGSSDFGTSQNIGQTSTILGKDYTYRITTQYYLYGTTAFNGSEQQNIFYTNVSFNKGPSETQSESSAETE
jgi:hypothetical protein